MSPVGEFTRGVGRLFQGRKASWALSEEFPPTAKPQIIQGPRGPVEVWPEKWGITTSQFARLLEECQEDADWSDDFTVAQLVQKYVIPRTQGTGLSYALMVNVENPKEVDVMISHAWAENALDFCRTLERSVQDHEPLFICALSLYQCEDEYGPSIAEQLGTHPQESPFHRVLKKIHDRGKEIEDSGGWWRNRHWLQRLPWVMLLISITCVFTPVILKGCIPMYDHCAYGTCHPLLEFLPVYIWEWQFKPLEGTMRILVRIGHIFGVLTVFLFVVVEILRWSGHIFKGRMVAVPNHNCEMYTRLWCVFEMFVAQSLLVPVKLANTLASAGEVNSAHAQCSQKEDAMKIHAQIRDYHDDNSGADEDDSEDEAGYKMLDEAIYQVSNKAWTRAILVEVLMAFPLALCLMCTVRLIKKGSMHWWQEQATKRGGLEWYHRVLYLASHGRLGYDLFCSEVFEASPKALWSWCLIIGTLLGYWIVLGSVVYVAKKAQGRITFCSIIQIALGLIFLEVVVNVLIVSGERLFGTCSHHPYRLNWFVIGFTAALAQGSLILLLLLLVVALRYILIGPPTLLGKNAEIAVKAFLVLAGIGAFLFIMFATCRVHRPEHFFPSIVNASLIFGWLLGPLAILWTNAVRFGVMLVPSTATGSELHHTYNEVTDSSDGWSDEP